MSFETYDTYKNKNITDLCEALPEAYGVNRSLIPDETFVLIAYYKNQAHLNWILKSKIYNARTDSTRASLRLGPGEAGAKYLLLHSEGELISGKLFKIIETGPRIFSKQTLLDKGYPTEPSREFYLVYKVEEVVEEAFQNRKWNISKLKLYKKGRGSVFPFSITLTDLMKVVSKR